MLINEDYLLLSIIVIVGEDEMSGRAELKITFDKPWKNFLGYSMLTLKSMRASTDVSRDEVIKSLGISSLYDK